MYNSELFKKNFPAIFDKMRAVIFITDNNGVIVDVNLACERYLKRKSHQFLGKNLINFIIAEDRFKYEALMVSENDEINYWELNFKLKDEDLVLLNCYKLRHENFIFIIARVNDSKVAVFQEELMAINNQMANLNREIEKKNKQLNQLNKLLQLQKQEIERKNAVLNDQLSIARKIQQHLVKKGDLKLYNLDFKMEYIPAYHIGGDYFDVIDLKNGKIGVFISDVSGHGISAALIMTIIKMIFSKHKQAYDTPSKLFELMNTEFIKTFGDELNEIYCAAFYCVIDTKNMTIEYCNAGNPGAFIFNKKIKSKMEEGNFPIGMFENPSYTSNNVVFEAEDKVAFFTDGFEEAILQFNYSSLDNTFLEQYFKKSFISDKIKEIGKLKDDISMIVVEVKKDNREGEKDENCKL